MSLSSLTKAEITTHDEYFNVFSCSSRSWMKVDELRRPVAGDLATQCQSMKGKSFIVTSFDIPTLPTPLSSPPLLS